MLGLSFSLLRCKGSENEASTDRTPSKMKTPPAKNFFPCMSGMSLCPAFRHRLTSLWHTFFGTIALMEFVLKNACQQFCSFSLAPCQRSYACPMAQGLETLTALGRTVFRNNRIDEICPLPASEAMHVTSPNVCKPLEKSWAHNFLGTIALMKFVLKTRANSSASQYVASSQRSSPQAISYGFPSVHPLVASVSLLPNGALPKLFPQAISHGFPSTLSSFPYRSFPPELSPCYFPKLFPTVSLPSTLSSFPYRSFPPELSPCYFPKLFPTVSLPSTLSSFPCRSFPPELSPSYFPRRPFRPPCHHSRIAPSHRSSSLAISHGFLSAHPVIISVSSLPYRSFPPELSPSYFPQFPFRPPCRHSRIAPSHRSCSTVPGVAWGRC